LLEKPSFKQLWQHGAALFPLMGFTSGGGSRRQVPMWITLKNREPFLENHAAHVFSLFHPANSIGHSCRSYSPMPPAAIPQ
jgi:hypothetical protein